jgi:hypothetical protein
LVAGKSRCIMYSRQENDSGRTTGLSWVASLRELVGGIHSAMKYTRA